MKINWGVGIIIGFVVFIGFILFFIIKMMTGPGHDLVTEEYYEKELLYQNEIDAETNANLLSENVKVVRDDNGLLIVFSNNFNEKKVVGNVFFYRPSNKQLDFTIPIELSSSQMLIPKSSLIGGRWNITVHWEYDDVKYLLKDNINY